MNRAKGYLYRRFSERRQIHGDSLTRQSRIATEWCIENNVELAETHTDRGFSAYTGKHAAIGALSKVLEAISRGEIASGSYLLVENFDRLGREDVKVAMARLLLILEQGIKVVTLMDGKVFDEKTEAPDLMMALIIMTRANEESLSKSKRATSVWEKKIAMLRSGVMPRIRVASWFTYNESTNTYDLNENQHAVKFIFEQYISGIGVNTLVKNLNETRYKSFNNSKEWAASTVLTTLKSRQACGDYERDGEVFNDVLPAVVSRENWLYAQSEIDRRRIRTGEHRKGQITNLLTGIATCECGMPMNLSGKDRALASGGIASYKYMICSASRNRANHCGFKPVRYKYVEAALVQLLSIVNALPTNKKDEEEKKKLITEIGAMTARIEETKSKISNAEDILINIPSESMMRKLQELEGDLDTYTKAKDKAERAMSQIEIAAEGDDLSERLDEISKQIASHEYRDFLRQNLPKIISKFVVRKDHSIDAVISGHRCMLTGVRGLHYARVDGKTYRIDVKADS